MCVCMRACMCVCGNCACVCKVCKFVPMYAVQELLFVGLCVCVCARMNEVVVWDWMVWANVVSTKAGYNGVLCAGTRQPVVCTYVSTYVCVYMNRILCG